MTILAVKITGLIDIFLVPGERGAGHRKNLTLLRGGHGKIFDLCRFSVNLR